MSRTDATPAIDWLAHCSAADCRWFLYTQRSKLNADKSEVVFLMGTAAQLRSVAADTILSRHCYIQTTPKDTSFCSSSTITPHRHRRPCIFGLHGALQMLVIIITSRSAIVARFGPIACSPPALSHALAKLTDRSYRMALFA